MFNFSPIGFLHCQHDYHQEQPMQGVLSAAGGYVELVKGFNYEQGLKDLEGFERVWLVYVFHHNSTWKPLTNPPYSDGRGRKGVFATRSPYRPNPIGLSCVKLQAIKSNRVYISGSDLLNNTPILDIKPYISDFDSFPASRRGWLEDVVKEEYEVSYSPCASAQLDFLLAQNIDLRGVIVSQLAHNPFDPTRNKFLKTEKGGILRFRSWRIEFVFVGRTILVERVYSGYKDFVEPLGDDSPQEVVIHQRFADKFV